MMRPASISENGNTATFAYTADGDRAKMLVSKNGTDSLTRYYLGGQYEFDQTLGATKEKLYLGGDAYSAAAVYVKSGSGSWQVYYLGRDYQGSITHLIDNSGNLVQEISYDPWGRLRNPGTLVSYTPGSEPTLFLDRGYTGHEHLAAFGLINMNARLYDPALGRFLSPDPYVQAPDFSQSFNRYSYCINNPLAFVDYNGNVWYVSIGHWVGKHWKTIATVAVTVVVVAAVTVATAGMGTIAAGAIIGGTGGFTSGAMGTWLNGGSFGQGLTIGLVNGAVGAVAGMAGGAFAGWASKNIGSFALNSLQVSGKSAIGGFISGAIAGSASGAAGGFITGLALTGDIHKAWSMAGQGALSGGITGGALGGYRGYKAAQNAGKDPWTGKSLKINTPNNNITFGRNPNQEYHTFRHTDELGLSRNDVESAVRFDLQQNANMITPGSPFNQTVNINGQNIQYTAYKLPDGTINVGRIHGVE